MSDKVTFRGVLRNLVRPSLYSIPIKIDFRDQFLDPTRDFPKSPQPEDGFPLPKSQTTLKVMSEFQMSGVGGFGLKFGTSLK